MIKIYTKTGDKGETSLFGGKRVSKADLRVEAYGTVDELNSAIGIVIAETQNYSSKLKAELRKIQGDLFEIGSILANPTTIYNLQPTTLEKRVGEFEKMIDEMTKELPKLRNFILPGGGVLGSYLHLTRSVARRAERRIVELSQKEERSRNEFGMTEILVYFNRLSDLLFTMARFINNKEKRKEVIWVKN